jgi:hypothetical protein
MVVVGADVHKRTHTFVAVDEVGRQLGEVTVSADAEGHAKALRGHVSTSRVSGDGASRTAGICRPGWSGTCSRVESRWCGCRPS